MPAWNPFIRSIQGALTPGRRLAVEIAPPGKSKIALKPKLLKVEPERELRWLGGLPIPGLFEGEHSFMLDRTAEGTRFHHAERFSGMLAGLIMRGAMADATRQGFEAMNLALKQEAEKT